MAFPNKKTEPLNIEQRPEALRRGRTTELMGQQAEIPEPPFRDTQKMSPDHHPGVEALLPRGVDPRILDGQAAEDFTAKFVQASQQQPGLQQALSQMQPERSPPKGARLTHPTSDRAEVAQLDMPRPLRPAPVGEKIDVSKADPRRAPTARVARRPEEYLAKDLSVARGHEAPAPQGSNFWTVALVLLSGLAILLGAALAYTQLVLRG